MVLQWKSWSDDGQTDNSTLLYPVSLLIGYWDWVQGGNPLYAAVKCLSGCQGHIWQKKSFIMQKEHGTPNSWPEIFFRGPKKILSPPNWLFFGSSVTFPELRDHFQNLHLLIIFSFPRKSCGNLQWFFSCACPIYGNSGSPFLTPFQYLQQQW